MRENRISLFMNYLAILIGLGCFLLIGICHPIVIKLEYYFGKQSYLWLLFLAIVFIICSFFCESEFCSLILGVIGFALLWSSREIIEQHKRVKQGRFPKNPNRDYED